MSVFVGRRHFFQLKQLLRGKIITPQKEIEEEIKIISNEEFTNTLIFIEEEKFELWYDDFAKDCTESSEEKCLLVVENDNPTIHEPVFDEIERITKNIIAEYEGYNYDE